MDSPGSCASLGSPPLPFDEVRQRDLRQVFRGVGRIRVESEFAEQSKEVGALGNIEMGGAPGGMTTVIQSSYTFWNPFISRVSPSMRHVADMKTDILYAALPTGNSGNMFSPHYRDMAPLFRKGELIPVSLTEKNPSWKKLVLIPE